MQQSQAAETAIRSEMTSELLLAIQSIWCKAAVTDASISVQAVHGNGQLLYRNGGKRAGYDNIQLQQDCIDYSPKEHRGGIHAQAVVTIVRAPST